jgi:hypothetical protein
LEHHSFFLSFFLSFYSFFLEHTTVKLTCATN